jgi:mono/diheme cytochrome c family protein
MRIAALLGLALLVGCGGGEPAAATVAPKPAETPKPTPKEEPADPAAEFAALDDAGKHAFLMKLGSDVYETGGAGGLPCATCHMADGKGTPGVFPPLMGQVDHMGDCAKHAGIVLNGLSGELVVDGQTYNGIMVPMKDLLDDLSIAAVITFERNAWGNGYGDCTPGDVASARAAK